MPTHLRAAFLTIFLTALSAGCGRSGETAPPPAPPPVEGAPAPAPALTGKITILQAASLSELFKRCTERFKQEHPGVEVEIESGGSLVLIRKVTDLHSAADLIAVADRKLIPTFLVPEFAEGATDFMTEEIAIIAGADAKHADEINAENWYDVLLREGVEFGASNPETAPVGYRTVMTWKLAEGHYQQPGLAERLRAALPDKNIRPNAVALLALLTSGELDYIFDYPSLATLHGLRAIRLPEEINLSSPRHAELYGTVSVDVPGEKPGETKSIKGEPIVYSIAMLKNAPNPALAKAWRDFLVGPQGKAIMAELGLSPLDN